MNVAKLGTTRIFLSGKREREREIGLVRSKLGTSADKFLSRKSHINVSLG
jgi:hypothetical protein